MNLKELNQLNKQKSFLEFREKFQRQLLLALTLGGTIIIALWQYFDKFYDIAQSKELFQLRGIALVLFILNVIVGLVRANDKAYKQHILVGFYLGTVFCTLLALYTGAGQSPYWYGLFFIIIAWFIVLPYSYTLLIYNGLSFVFIFTGIIFTQHTSLYDALVYFRIFSIYSGILVVGFIAAINRNKADAFNYLSTLKIQEANEELQSVNEELRAEVESHCETACKLEEQQLFLDNILKNAPIVIWSIDLEGKFTYTHGKGLEKIGVKPGENVGKSIFDVYKGTDAEIFIKQVIEGKIEQDIIKIGNLTYDTRVTPLLNSNGAKYGYMGVAMDVTEQKKAELDLKKFRLVLDQAPGAVFIMDKNFCFEYINPHFTKISGYSAEELIHKNINETLYHGQVPESRKYITESILKGNSWQGELLTINKNGTNYWANTIAAPYKNAKNEVEGYIVIQQDITERKKMELAIQESENLYRTLIENSLDGVVLTQDFKFSFINTVFLQMMGYTHDELMQIEPTSILAPEDRQRVMEYHAQRLRGEIKAQTYKAAFIKKDGSRFTAELNSTSVMIKGQPASLITMRDITERENLIKTIEESESKYKTLVENSQDGITIIRDNRILFANDTYCRMLGYSRDELYNMPSVATLHPSEHHKAFDIAIRRHNHDFSTINEVFNFVTKDGQIKECETSSTLIQYQGQWASFFTSHDITESKRMQEALRESEEKYRELVETTNSIILKWDKDFKITFLNEYGLQFFGFTREEIENKPMVGTIVPHSEEFTGRNLDLLMEDIFKNPEKYAHNINENIRKNGERVWVSWNNTAISDENGMVTDMFSVGMDITERRKNEEELRITKEKLQTLNQNLENQVSEAVTKLTEANTQLIRLQKENLQSQFEVLRQQVNPHFLFNSLNVLTSLIKLEPDLAEKFTEHLSKVYRYVLENKDNDLVSLQTELDFLDAYLFLLNIRFMDKIKVHININLDRKAYLILPLALQLIIENAIKHNTMSKKAPLVIQIFADENLMLNIINNLQERESHMVSTGVGLKNIAHRYELLELPAPVFEKTDNQFIAKIPLRVVE